MILNRSISFVRKHPTIAFLSGAFFWSWGIWFGLIAAQVPAGTQLWDLVYILGLSGPTLAGVAITGIAGGREGLRELRRQLLRTSGWRWLAVALALPVCLVFAALSLAYMVGGFTLKVTAPSLYMLAAYFVVTMLRSGPLNEELGWRGFLLPRLLRRFNPLTASLLLAPVWAVWHVPLWFLPLVPHSYWPFSAFVLLVIPTTFLFTWLYLRTQGGLAVAIVFHTSINASLLFLPILPPRSPSFLPFAFWIGVIWVVAVWVLARQWKEFARPADWPAPPQGWFLWPRLQRPPVVAAPIRSCRGRIETPGKGFTLKKQSECAG
jgi:membrane protease YdiL (CAAX protease family)